MAKLKLQPAPTFKGKVTIHVPGQKPGDVEFIFKYRDRDEQREFFDSIGGMDDTDFIMAMASGWDLEDAFTRENVELLVKNFNLAAKAVWEKYAEELTGARLGN